MKPRGGGKQALGPQGVPLAPQSLNVLICKLAGWPCTVQGRSEQTPVWGSEKLGLCLFIPDPLKELSLPPGASCLNKAPELNSSSLCSLLLPPPWWQGPQGCPEHQARE